MLHTHIIVYPICFTPSADFSFYSSADFGFYSDWSFCANFGVYIQIVLLFVVLCLVCHD